MHPAEKIKRVARIRDRYGISQIELASAVGISRGHLSMLENGHYRTKAETLYLLDDCLRKMIKQRHGVVLDEHLNVVEQVGAASE
jgi:transcriptional regulator with XRE-family HTH domain